MELIKNNNIIIILIFIVLIYFALMKSFLKKNMILFNIVWNVFMPYFGKKEFNAINSEILLLIFKDIN